MKTSHKLILALCKTIMVFSASVFVVSTILLTVVLRPEPIKQWVASSGLYEVIATEIRTQIQQSFTGSAANSPLVGRALEQTITSKQIQSTAEKGIDGSFAWLKGEGGEPRFELNETEIRTTLASQIIAGLRERAKRLPTCSLQNPPLTSDIFTINCLPPGTNVEQQLTQVRAEIAENTDVNPRSSTSIQTQEGTTTQNPVGSQEIINQVQDYRKAYQWLQITPVVATILFIVSGVIIFIIIKPKYRFLRTLSLALIPQAILLIIAGWLTPRAAQSSSDAILGQMADTPFAKSVQYISMSATNAISSGFTRAGLVIGLVGLGLLLAYILVNNKFKPRTTDPPQPTAPSNSTPSSS